MCGLWLKLILTIGVIGLVQSGGYTMDRTTSNYQKNTPEERMRIL